MKLKGACLGLLLLPWATGLQAQAIKNEPPMRHFEQAEVDAIAMPALAFDETPEMAADYDKYFYYHRPDTSFDQAYADVTECDALSSGSSYYYDSSAAMAGALANSSVLAAGIGGAIGSLVMDAIFGSAERRKARRINIRNCMFYKGYSRYGLDKDLWQEFNFEEGMGKEDAETRNAALLAQARVASGPTPAGKALEP